MIVLRQKIDDGTTAVLIVLTAVNLFVPLLNCSCSMIYNYSTAVVVHIVVAITLFTFFSFSDEDSAHTPQRPDAPPPPGEKRESKSACKECHGVRAATKQTLV